MHVPNELCEEIVRHIDSKTDLYNLLFTSRVFQREAHLAMLTIVDMVRWIGRDKALSLQRLKQMFTFISQPDNLSLGRAVQRLVYVPHVIEDEVLDIVIPQMINLRHLQYERNATDPIDQAPVAIHPSFLRCPCKLSSLAIHDMHINLVGCIPFLNMQPEIEDLGLSTSLPLEFSDKSVLSNVTKLSFIHMPPLSSLRAFLIDRTVIRMSLNSLSMLDFQDSNDFRHLRVLSCTYLGTFVAAQPVFQNVEVLFIHKVSNDQFDHLIPFFVNGTHEVNRHQGFS